MKLISPRDRGALRLGRTLQDRLRKRKHPVKWPWLTQIVLIDHSTFHYELHALQLVYIFQRVAADGYDVRPFPRFDDSQLVAPPKQLSSSGSASAYRLHRRHAVLHVVFKFFRLVQCFPVEAAGIRAQGNLHALLDGLWEIFTLQLRHLWPVATAARGNINADGNGRHPVNPSPDHFIHQGFSQAISVLDGVHTSIDRKSTRLNSSHTVISYAVFCLKK